MESVSEKKEIYKILGVSWKIDCNKFLFDLKEIIEEALSYDVMLYLITKKVVLKVISSIFDPLGILSPIVINPFVHNVVNGQTYFQNLAVFTPQDFTSMFDHFITSCMKGF